MRYQRFNPVCDLDTLNEWLELRGAPLVEVESIPRNGLIAYYEDEPVAMAFLRLCEGKFMMLDGLTTNPEASGPVRHAAIDGLVERLIARAKDLGMTDLLAWSVDTGTLERSKRHGFKASPYTLITKNLRGDSPLCQ